MKVLDKIFFRTFLLQSAWSYDRMQNIGFLFAIYPKLKELYGHDAALLKESCKRYIGYFNTHPYMSTVILGVTARLEEMISEGMKEKIPEQHRYKLQMAGPLAAMGDKMFWSIWRAVAGLAAVFMILLPFKPYVMIPFVYLLLYNTPVILHKRATLRIAYKSKELVMKKLENINKSLMLTVLPFIGIIIMIASIVLLVLKIGLIQGGVFTVTVVLVVFAREIWRLSATKLMYLITLAVVVVRYLLL